MGVGSGGVVARNTSATYILTAKHVLDPGRKKPSLSRHMIKQLIYLRSRQAVTSPDIVYSQLVSKTLKFTPLKFEYYVGFSTGAREPISSTDCDKHNDMCIAKVQADIKVSKIKLSNTAPNIGDRVYCAAAPFGMAMPQIQVVPYFSGHYSGTDRPVYGRPAHSWFTILSAPGSSGSLVLNKSGDLVGLVVGISVGEFCAAPDRCVPMRSGITIAVPHAAIKEFLKGRL